MRKIRDVLRLRLQAGLSFRQISLSTKVSVGAIQKLLKTAEQLQLAWPPGFDTSPRFSPLFGKCLQRWRGFQGHDRKSAVVARL